METTIVERYSTALVQLGVKDLLIIGLQQDIEKRKKENLSLKKKLLMVESAFRNLTQPLVQTTQISSIIEKKMEINLL